MRNFDVTRQYESVKRSAVAAIESIFPVVGKLRTLRLDKVWVEDKLDPTDYASQAKAKSKEGTWGVPVYASLSLIENTGSKVVDRAEKVKLFNLPKITDRWSYIVSGNEYQVSSQLRLKPGVYTLRKQNGELKTQVNLARGKNFDLGFDEVKGTFTIQKIGGGQANIPLYPILTHLGVSPVAIAKAWGSRLEAANKTSDPKAVARAEAAFGLKAGALKDYLNKTEISSETTKLVLGMGFEKVDGPMLLASSKNLLDVHLGKKEPVDRDSLAFKELHSVEDFIKERLEKNQRTLAFKVKRSIDNLKREKITQIVNPESFNSVVETFFTQDDKSSTPEQTNPLEMISGGYKATIMGSGGIKSEHAVTPEMREIHPSHYGFLDPIHTPESGRIGANLHIATGAIKDGKNIRALLRDKNGKVVALTPTETFEKYVAFPGQKGPVVQALYRGKVLDVPVAKVDYFTPTSTALFSPSTNLVPFLPSNQGNRAMMASKMLEQAIALKHREAPLVQVGLPTKDAVTVENEVGKTIAVTAPEDGVVTSVSKDTIKLKTASGVKTLNLYNNFTLNRKSFLHHTVLVKAGDKVVKGQVLADSNFTKGGTLALGVNLRAAYLPYKGLNFEDGLVITESAADKLTSEHIHKKTFAIDENTVMSLVAFKSHYPNALTGQNLAKLDNDGVIKKGAKIKMGEALIAALRKRVQSADIALIHKPLANRPKDVSVYWTMEDDGEILDVQKSGKKIIIQVKTEERAKIGDKLSGRMGNKGIITKIIPDSLAPHNTDGKPIDIILNPHGVISRINIGQIYESAVGKAAAKDGKPISVGNFTGENYLATTKKILKERGVNDKEKLIDPETGKELGEVHVGNPYILKLFKQGTHNFSTRQGGSGTPYDMNHQPLKAGGEDGAKAVDLLTMYSLLSHGARANLREMTTYKSDQNDEFWRALKSGQLLPPPKSPFVYDKFIGYLKGAGVDVKKDGTKLTLAPLTDKQVKDMSSAEIKKPLFIRGKDLEPIPGGFFDTARLGGLNGNKWGHMNLTEPVLNPVFEGAAQKLLGLGKQFNEIVDGKLFLDAKGNLNRDGKGDTGGRAIERLLQRIDIPSMKKTLIEKAKKAKAADLDKINKQLRYLEGLTTAGLRPEEAYIRRTMPVVPAAYRPLYPLPDGNIGASDVNHLYQNVGIINLMMQKPVMDLLPEEDKATIRKDLYEHVKGVSGLTDISIKGREREGFISEIKGGAKGQPKEGYFISKMLSKKQDLVGRGTIIPEPTLGLDQMGMPEEMAWKLFEPFVVRELRNHGKMPLQAKEEIKKKTLLAKRALEIVMKDRHVLLNRAPSLHKFSIMAFKPTLTTGRAVKIPPLVVKGFNADFDGDTMTVHSPITDEANREAEKLLPSRNLFQPGSGSLMVAPSQEAQIGIFYLSQTEAGRKRLNQILPKAYAISTVLDKKTTQGLLKRLAKELKPQDFGTVVADLKAEGEKHAFERGFTLGVNDLAQFTGARNKIIGAVATSAKKISASTNAAKVDADLNALNSKATKLFDKLISKKLQNKGNPLYDMVHSGARGDNSQLRSILATPLFMSDARGKIVASPIKNSYAEGLGIGDYWTSMYGARRGMMDRAIQTSLPGAFSKDIMATTIDNVVSGEDCGTKEGVFFKIDDHDALDRFLAGDQGGFSHNTLVEAKVISSLKKNGLSQVKVRSPLRCMKARGTCAKCYGLDEHGGTPSVGDNIGAKAGQTISEPLVQLIMRTFHTGGAAGTGADVQGYARVNQLLQLPKIVSGAAPLAPKSGKVTKITKGLAGGYDVVVEGAKKVHVPQGRNLKVKVGATVSAGDPLSDGVIKPQDLVKHKGMLAAQEYISNELKSAYQSQGVGIQRKMFETVVRSLGNTTQVLNNPSDSGYLPGDVIPYTVAEDYNKNLNITVPVDKSAGYKLATTAGKFKAGHVIADTDVKVLRALGIRDVVVQKDPIKHAPFLKGMSTLPLLRRDWMAALGYRQLSKNLVEGASQGWSTDLSDYHPVPAFVHGATFGKGKDGKY